MSARLLQYWLYQAEGRGASLLGALDGCLLANAHPPTLQDKEQEKKLKQKQRERMQPKMGKLDIDYQVHFSTANRMHTPRKRKTIAYQPRIKFLY